MVWYGARAAVWPGAEEGHPARELARETASELPP